MRVGRTVIGLVLLFFALVFFTVPNGAICGAPLIIIGLVVCLSGVLASPPAPVPPPQPVYVVQQPVYYPTYPPPPPPQVIQQKEVVTREIVKVRCRYCGALVDEGVNVCPRCQAPVR